MIAIPSYIIVLRHHFYIKKLLKYRLKITPKYIIIDKKAIPKENILKSIYNISTGVIFIYLKNRNIIKIHRDLSKLWFSNVIIEPQDFNFDYLSYGKALKKIEIPFEVVRKKVCLTQNL